MKKSIVGIFIFLLFSLFLYFSISAVDLYICNKTAGEMKDFTQTEYLRIKLYGSSFTEEGDTVSGTFSIIDTNGNEIAVIERSWNGAYLGVDFSELKLNGCKYIFPSKIYGKKSIVQSQHKITKGTSLEKYYNENGQCILLGYSSSKQQRKNLYKLARFTLSKKNIFSFKYKKTLTIDLSSCINGKYYSIVSVPSGNLLLREL